MRRAARSSATRIPDRGAGMVESALAIALVAIVLVGVVGAFQDAESDQLHSSGERIGMPDLDAAPPVPSSIAPPAGDDGSTGTDGGTTFVAVSWSQSAEPGNGNNWTARVAFAVPEADGAVIAGEWTPTDSRNAEVRCTVGNGSCSVSRWGLHGNHHPDATFRITSVSGPGYAPAEGVVGTTITVTRP